MRSGQPLKTRGFTLIEVLAALVIFSISIIGLTHAGAQSVRTVTALQDKMLASIVADNQLVAARQGELVLGVSSGTETQMSQSFEYRLETTSTDVPDFFRLTVTIQAQSRSEDQSQVLVSRTAFRGRGS